MKKKNITLAVSLIALSFLVGCQEKKDQGEWIAKVGTTPIFKSALEQKASQLTPEIKQQISSNEQARVQVLSQLMNGLVSDTLILEEAKKAGYTANADYIEASTQLEKRLEEQKQQALITLYLRDNVDAKITVTDQEVVEFFNKNQDRFKEFELRRASHILVATKEEANKLRQQLREGANFEELAKTYSIDVTSGKNGGDVGEFTKSGTPAEFVEVAYGLRREGSISNVFESPLGFHIVKLTGIRVVPERKLQDIADNLKRDLYISKRNQMLQTLINELKEKYPITLKENEPVASKAAPQAQPKEAKQS